MHIEGVILYLRELNFISIFVRVSLAALFSGVIGFGREIEKRPAGLRTHILVCIGSTLAMLTNVYILKVFGGGIDPTRIGAQVISGIGFLGAGTIIVTGKNKVRGLTTAAGLWSSACMGLAIGVGFYEGAIIGCLFILFVTAIFGKLDRRINKKSRNIILYIIVNSSQVLSSILNKFKNNKININVKDVEINNYNINCNELIGLLITIKIPNNLNHKDIIGLFDNEDGVIFFQEIE